LLPGTIKEVFYLGDFSEMSVMVDNTGINLTVHMTRGWNGPDMQLTEGQRVVAQWPGESMNLTRWLKKTMVPLNIGISDYFSSY
jgi:hypothetical protein